jgi:hypothetical protein
MSETSVTIDGVRSPLLEFGPPNTSEAVVFVHGNPGSNRDWESLARGVGHFGRAARTACEVEVPCWGPRPGNLCPLQHVKGRE